jgi:hypothetical protein
MLYELVTSPAAFRETDNAYDYYENQSPGLGDRFLKSLEDAYQKLAIGLTIMAILTQEKISGI